MAYGGRALRRMCLSPMLSRSEGVSSLQHVTQEQEAVVKHKGGPAIVLAGPGTGKSHTIASRALYLMQDQHIPPHELLVLTFSERATVSIQSKIDLHMPLGGDSIVKTFHSFGNDIVQEFGIEVGVGYSQLLTPAEEAVLLKHSMAKLPLQRYRPSSMAAEDALVLSLLSHFGKLQDAAIDPQRYFELIEMEQEQRASRSSKADTDFFKGQIELASIYRVFADIKRGQGALNFSDLITSASHILSQRPSVAECIAKRYKHYMVDEFQDVNKALFDFINLILQVPSHSNDNVIAIGDDDQCIFSFRSAGQGQLKNPGFDQMLSTFPDSQLYTLSKNFRSSDPIVSRAESIIQLNSDRMKNAVVACRPTLCAREGASAPEPKHILSRTGEEEQQSIELLIKRIVRTTDYSYRDIAVLTRYNSNVQHISDALSRSGIPAVATGSCKLTKYPEILMILNFLKCLVMPEDTSALYGLLVSPAFESMHFENKLKNVAVDESLLEHVKRLANAGDRECRMFLKEMTEYRAELSTASTRELIVFFLRRRQLMDRLFQAQDSFGDSFDDEAARLFQFFKRLESIEKSLDTDKPVFVVPYITSLEKFGEEFTTRTFSEEQAELHAANGFNETLVPDCVHTMTIHKSKGLEYPIVILARCVEGELPCRFRRLGLPMLESVSGSEASARNLHVEEERRLAYVAITRARDMLFFTSAQNYSTSFLRPSRFIFEALGKPGTELDSPSAAVTEGIKLSHSRLETYERCPKRYHYQYVLGLETEKNVPLMFGSALHESIAFLAKHISADDALRLSPDEMWGGMKAIFDMHWDSTVFRTEQEEKRKYAQGLTDLERFFHRETKQERTPRSVPRFVEQEFSFNIEGHSQSNILVRGIWDRIDDVHDGNSTKTIIREFKSRISPYMQRRAKQNTQVHLYSVAYQQVFGKLPDYVVLEEIGSGKEFTYIPKEEDCDRAIRRVVTLASRISQDRFAPDASMMECRMCPFSHLCPHTAIQ